MILSVVICTYNRAALLPHTLTALTQQTIPSERFEVIVVDNNSQDNTTDIAAKILPKFKNHRLLHESKQGLSHARNCGWRAATGKYVAFLDDDAKAAPDWCERIVTAFTQTLPIPSAVGGPIYPWYEIPPPSWFSDTFEIRTWGSEAGLLPESRARFGFSGSNMAFPKEVLEQYRGFNPNFGMVGDKLLLGEEAELFSRIFEDKPYFWYDPNIKVYHWVPVRNMKVSYRLTRMFKSGRARAKIERQQAVPRKTCLECIHLLAFIKDLVVVFLPPWQLSKPLIVEKLCRVANQIGLLLGYCYNATAIKFKK